MTREERRARPRGKPQDGWLSDERLRFCEGILAGKSVRQAYEESGFKSRGTDAATNGRQLLKSLRSSSTWPHVARSPWARAELDAERVIQEMATSAVEAWGRGRWPAEGRAE